MSEPTVDEIMERAKFTDDFDKEATEAILTLAAEIERLREVVAQKDDLMARAMAGAAQAADAANADAEALAEALRLYAPECAVWPKSDRLSKRNAALAAHDERVKADE